MSNKYKDGDEVPTDILCNRVDYLVDVITGRVKTTEQGFIHEFSMRVPAELDHDADLVLSALSKRVRKLEARVRELEEKELPKLPGVE